MPKNLITSVEEGRVTRREGCQPETIPEALFFPQEEKRPSREEDEERLEKDEEETSVDCCTEEKVMLTDLNERSLSDCNVLFLSVPLSSSCVSD